ncbi:MAG: TonB-dependent receptor [Bacteroidales bacterium]
MKKNFNQPISIRFRRFSRKSYAVFCSLNKEVSIGRLSVDICNCSLKVLRKVCTVLVVLAGSIQISAQDSLTHTLLDEVLILGQQNALISEQLRIISSISRQEIASLPAQDLNELLNFLPGIDVRQRGAGGTQADLSLRGGTFDQVLVLLNGINITDVQTGHYSLDIPILLSQIDRIEILQGSSMSLFGLSAFSGAINIVTGQSKDNELLTSIVGGSYGLFTPSIKGNFSKDKWSFMGALSHNSSNGHIHNTDFNNNNLFLQANYKDKEMGKFDTQVGFQTKDYGANAFYSSTYPEQFEAVKTLIASTQWEKLIKRFSLNASIFYRRHHDRYELFREEVQDKPTWYTNHNYHLTDVLGTNFKTAYFSKIGKSSLGIELRNEHIFSNVLGDSLKTPHKIPLEKTDEVFIYGKNRLNINYFAEQVFFISKLSASIGVSGNYNSMFKTNFAFGTNLGYKLKRHTNIYLSLNRALRLPNYTDLYYKSATQISNPNLKPESSITLEIGAKHLSKHFHSNTSLFYRIGTDIIDWIKLPEDEQWKSMNHAKINTFGTEFSTGLRGYYWLKNLAFSYSYINANKTADKYISKYALDYLQHKASIRLEHRIWENFGATWQLLFQKRNGNYEDLNGEVIPYKAFELFDARVYWKNQTINIFIEANNILNKKYFDFAAILQPQRWVKTGIQITWK